jgi:putative addiction module component (TIGR02574 family)
MSDYDSLLADASRLPVGQRIQLIEALWGTVPAEGFPPLSEEWTAEIQARSAEYEAGLAQAIPWPQVKSDALHRMGQSATDDAH